MVLIYLHHDHDRRSGCDGAGIATLHCLGNRIRRYHAVCHCDNRPQCGAAANPRRPFGNTPSASSGNAAVLKPSTTDTMDGVTLTVMPPRVGALINPESTNSAPGHESMQPWEHARGLHSAADVDELKPVHPH